MAGSWLRGKIISAVVDEPVFWGYEAVAAVGIMGNALLFGLKTPRFHEPGLQVFDEAGMPGGK
jgi:hypothetical protein